MFSNNIEKIGYGPTGIAKILKSENKNKKCIIFGGLSTQCYLSLIGKYFSELYFLVELIALI